MITCSCGATAGTAPTVTTTDGDPLCDSCIASIYGAHHLATIDQLRASATAAASHPRRHDPEQEWLTGKYRDFVQLVGVLPSMAHGAFSEVFLEWLKASDPDGLARHWPTLTGEDS